MHFEMILSFIMQVARNSFKCLSKTLVTKDVPFLLPTFWNKRRYFLCYNIMYWFIIIITFFLVVYKWYYFCTEVFFSFGIVFSKCILQSNFVSKWLQCISEIYINRNVFIYRNKKCNKWICFCLVLIFIPKSSVKNLKNTFFFCFSVGGPPETSELKLRDQLGHP